MNLYCINCLMFAKNNNIYSHTNLKDSLETRAVLLIFLLHLKISGWPYREYIKIAKIVSCSEKFVFGDDFDAVLAIFCSYGYGAKTFEAVEKIAIDEKDYHKFPLCATVCIATTYQ